MNPQKRRAARTPRFYLNAAISTEQTLILPKPASHHLIKVLRMRIDTPIELFNDDGYNYRATLIDTGQQTPGKCAVLSVHDRYQPATESMLQILLVQAISSGDRMDTTLRQSVELGVSAIQPIYTRHSVKTLDEKRLNKKMEHWQNIVISACEQSGRACLPELAAPVELSQWLKGVSDVAERTASDGDAQHFMLSPHCDRTLSNIISSNLKTLRKASVLIGPESGFDTDEIDLAVEHGIQAVSFGPRILRTETAAPACIASLQMLLGDLGSAAP